MFQMEIKFTLIVFDVFLVIEVNIIINLKSMSYFLFHFIFISKYKLKSAKEHIQFTIFGYTELFSLYNYLYNHSSYKLQSK